MNSLALKQPKNLWHSVSSYVTSTSKRITQPFQNFDESLSTTNSDHVGFEQHIRAPIIVVRHAEQNRTHTPKRIAICCDGTWNTPDQQDEGIASASNVVKMALAAASEGDDGVRQVMFYHPGVGAGRFDHLRCDPL